MNRPSIPAEIRRKALVEAGHRCAIPHCASTEIDVHHIIPWETCQEHSPENLIALCPNCHRRADRGDIDRKSLIIYKLRGQRIFRGQPPEVISSADAWSTRTFQEKRDDSLKYVVEAEYPYFNPDEYRWAEEANLYIQTIPISEAQGIRNLANEAPWTWNSVEPDSGDSSFGASYDVGFFQARLLSVRFNFFAYYFGAAHPMHWTRTLNLFLDPVYKIELKHFFGGTADYLEKVSNAVRGKLTDETSGTGFNVDRAWMIKGTEPQLENFSKFNFSTFGFLFTFDEYSIGPYAAGRQEIWIPFSELSGLVLPDEVNERT
jgi:hypothetical protein